MLMNSNIGKTLTAYHYEVRCNACRETIERGNRLEAIVQMLAHMNSRHQKDDWINMLKAKIIQMIWVSPQVENGRSPMSLEEILDFMSIMAHDQDISYEDWLRFRSQDKTGR
jgi:hypothetical protein